MTRHKECSICYDAFAKSNNLIIFQCGHKFHSDCIFFNIRQKYFAQKRLLIDCPYCLRVFLDVQLEEKKDEIMVAQGPPAEVDPQRFLLPVEFGVQLYDDRVLAKQLYDQWLSELPEDPNAPCTVTFDIDFGESVWKQHIVAYCDKYTQLYFLLLRSGAKLYYLRDCDFSCRLRSTCVQSPMVDGALDYFTGPMEDTPDNHFWCEVEFQPNDSFISNCNLCFTVHHKHTTTHYWTVVVRCSKFTRNVRYIFVDVRFDFQLYGMKQMRSLRLCIKAMDWIVYINFFFGFRTVFLGTQWRWTLLAFFVALKEQEEFRYDSTVSFKPNAPIFSSVLMGHLQERNRSWRHLLMFLVVRYLATWQNIDLQLLALALKTLYFLGYFPFLVTSSMVEQPDDVLIFCREILQLFAKIFLIDEACLLAIEYWLEHKNIGQLVSRLCCRLVLILAHQVFVWMVTKKYHAVDRIEPDENLVGQEEEEDHPDLPEEVVEENEEPPNPILVI